MFIDMCMHTSMEVCIDVCTDLCIDVFADMCVYMSTDMWCMDVAWRSQIVSMSHAVFSGCMNVAVVVVAAAACVVHAACCIHVLHTCCPLHKCFVPHAPCMLTVCLCRMPHAHLSSMYVHICMHASMPACYTYFTSMLHANSKHVAWQVPWWR